MSVYGDLADRYGFRRVAAGEVPALRACDTREIMRRVGLPAWKLPFVAAQFKRLMAENCASIRLFPGIGDALQRLHAGGGRLGIVSSNSRENVTAVLGPKLATLIDHFECGATIFGKRRLIERVLKASGAARTQAIYIGDQIADLEAARTAGVAFGAVAWGYADIAALEAHGPERVFRKAEELTQLVTE